MNGEAKRKFEIPGGRSTEELTRIDDLLRKVISVPKEEKKRGEPTEKKTKEKKI